MPSSQTVTRPVTQPSQQQDISSASAADTPVLTMRNIRHAYDGDNGHVAVKHVDLDVYPGEVVCLLGPSGCGKTTLLRIVAGLERVQQGSVTLNGKVVGQAGMLHLPPEKRNVGLAFQESALFPHLNVLENVIFGLESLPFRKRQQRAIALLEQLGMAQHVKDYPHTLSGGQQQRVALARALAPSPQLMLLDEPFSSLDARLRDQIRDDTLHVLKDVGAGALLVTHDPEEAMFMADRIALMRDGHIVQIGTPQELYCTPNDPFVVRFFGEVNELAGVVWQGRVATPLGDIDTQHLEDGTQVRIMVRPEALCVKALNQGPASNHDNEHNSHVLMARLLGRTSLLHICAHDADGNEAHMHARVPGVFLPQEGQPISLNLDCSQVFVFPVERND